jgi:hypothetical protein
VTIAHFPAAWDFTHTGDDTAISEPVGFSLPLAKSTPIITEKASRRRPVRDTIANSAFRRIMK